MIGERRYEVEKVRRMEGQSATQTVDKKVRR
jgi:hypothetical protein